MYVKSGSDVWFKAGLGKSAFTSKIYDFPLDYYIPGIQNTFSIFNIMSRRLFTSRVKPKFYQLHDAYMMFYKPSEKVFTAVKKKPKRKTVWWSIINNFIHTDEFMKINNVTKGSQELSALAGARFLVNLLTKISADDMSKDESTVSVDLNTLKGIGSKVLSEVAEFKEAKESAEEAVKAIAGLEGGESFTHEALSILTFLKEPDEFRKRVRILKYTLLMLKKFTAETPSSLTHQQQVDVYGTISGATKMVRDVQIKDILPHELAILRSNAIPKNIAKILFTIKLLQKQVMVSERATSIKPVIFVDKSGSMSDYFENDIPKISVASGLALALFRKLNAEVYLFDTEVEKVKPRDIVKVLLTIRGTGGTDITEVLNEVIKIGKKERIYIVITDGIDEVDENVVSEVKKAGLADKIRFILVPPAWEQSWLRNFRYVYARDIASFTTAVRKMLR